MPAVNRKLSVAPMMTHTDRHFRYLLRLISRHVMLYTEMVTTGALLYGDPLIRLAYNKQEHPLGLQLGGSDPAALGQCARLAEEHGYDEVNLNVGCPSKRVKSGRFGASLMAEPALVAECVASMQGCATIPVSIKTRIGIDDRDSYEHLFQFISTLQDAGCRTVILHARKAWLSGLSPRQNREIPPLQYEVVHKIKCDFPALEIIINGGVTSLEQSLAQYRHVDGVMLGRAVCNNPYLLAEADSKIFNRRHEIPSRREILYNFMAYIETELAQGGQLRHTGRHILGLYHGLPGACAYRRYLSENIHQPDSGIEIIERAMNMVEVA